MQSLIDGPKLTHLEDFNSAKIFTNSELTKRLVNNEWIIPILKTGKIVYVFIILKIRKLCFSSIQKKVVMHFTHIIY